MTAAAPIRVLLIDDATLLARAVAAELNHTGLHVLTAAGNMPEIRERLLQFHPDVLVLDLALRTLRPLELLRRLRQHYPVPVLVTSATGEPVDTRAATARASGAADVICKPASARGKQLTTYVAELAARIRSAATLTAATAATERRVATARGAGATCAGPDPARRLVAIGASTGGTLALEALFRHAPAAFPPVVVVQHMPVGFTRAFARRLNERSALAIDEATDGETLGPGRAVIARGDTQLVVRAAGGGWRVCYTDQVPVNRHCPSVDVLFDSVAGAAGNRGIGVLLSGMGADGARGLLRIRAAGGQTIGQTADTCVVYGMPKVAAELGAVQHSAAPAGIPELILRLLGASPRPAVMLP